VSVKLWVCCTWFYILTRIGHSFWTGNVSHLIGLVLIFFSSELIETSQKNSNANNKVTLRLDGNCKA